MTCPVTCYQELAGAALELGPLGYREVIIMRMVQGSQG